MHKIENNTSLRLLHGFAYVYKDNNALDIVHIEIIDDRHKLVYELNFNEIFKVVRFDDIIRLATPNDIETI